MPWSGSGTFLELTAPEFPAVPGEIIYAEYFNAVIRDILEGFSNAITRDGQSPALANLPMGGFKHTGVGVATATGQYLTFDQATSLYIPWSQKSADYTLVLTDAGKGFEHPASDATPRTITIPANATVPMPHGGEGYATAVTFVNYSDGALSIAIAGGDTLRLAGSATTGTRSLAKYGLATALKTGATTWLISGTGLT